MNTNKCLSWKLIARTFHAILVLALLFGLIPPSFALAAGPDQPVDVTSATDACQWTPGAQANKLFLPVIASSAGQVTVAGGQVNQAVGQVPTPRQLQYQVGKTYIYEWKLAINTKSASRDSQGTNENGRQTTVIHAFADVTIQAKEADGTFAGQLSIRDPFICSTTGDGTESVADDPELFNALKQPMLFKQAPNGTVTQVSSPADAPVTAVNMQKGIINALQVSLKEGENVYTVEESGAQGRYNVHYTLEDKEDGLYIAKSFTQDSFTALLSAGDKNKTLKLQNRIDLLLDDQQGVIKSVKVTEDILSSDESQDPDDMNNQGITGVAAWSAVATEGSLTLTQVSDADAVLAAQAFAGYRTSDLGAQVSATYPNAQGIDLTKVNLEAEFAALESDPRNPALVSRLANLADADAGSTVLSKVRERLQQNSANQTVAAAYIDVLVSVGTAAAQEILNEVLGNRALQAAQLSATLNITTQEHALIGLVVLESPTVTTVNTLRALSNDKNAPLHGQATSVLGATAYNIADEDPQVAASIRTDLAGKLQAATERDQIKMYLDALGNAGDPASLDLIDNYITDTLRIGDNLAITDTLEIQIAAVTALRKLPGNGAEGLLLAVLGDADNDIENYIVRETVATILANREDRSEAAGAALEAYEQAQATVPGGLYQRNWYQHLGGQHVGVHLPGRVMVASPPSYYPFLYAIQEANAHIWSFTPNLVRGQLLGNAYDGRVGAYLSIANNLIYRQYEVTWVSCNYSRSGTLYQGSLPIFSVWFRIPIFWALSIDLNVKGTGYFSLTYNYQHSVCNLYASSMVGTITPSVWANAEASASTDIIAARGGATLTADLLKTSLPVSFSMAYNGSLRFCTDVRVNTQSLNGKLYVWGDLRVPRWSWPFWEWRRIVQKDLWTFYTPSASSSLLVACW